ncbi:MAG TPA: hypothetical protein O0X39_01285 [Methanocorpusculum sp.]|nr:hypothetical protein [Methanocorpusculum sp.]
MTILTQSGGTLTANFGGNVTWAADNKTQDVRAVTIGGTNKPMLVFGISNTKNSISITVPAGYGGEPAAVIVNSRKVETATLNAAAAASIIITAPTAGDDITATGTATAKVLDQYGEEITTDTVTWSSSDSTKLSIVSSTGVYTPVATATEVTITATHSTESTITQTVKVKVTVEEP